jgi:hypothetical protein
MVGPLCKFRREGVPGLWGSTFPERGGGFAHKVPVARNIAESEVCPEADETRLCADHFRCIRPSNGGSRSAGSAEA